MAFDESLVARLHRAFNCGTNPSEELAISLIGELLTSWQTDGIPTASIAGVTQVPSATTATEDGSVSEGAVAVTFISSDDFVGTILGQSFPANATLNLSASSNNYLNNLAEIAYTINAGSLLIFEIGNP